MTGPQYGQIPQGSGPQPVHGLPYQGIPPGMSGQHPYPQPSGAHPVQSRPYNTGQPSGPYPVPSGPYPSGQSAPHPAQPQNEWTYGLPPGVRPDLLKAPLGQHGSMPRTAWELRGRTKTSFARLIIVELRKLAGTLTDRLLLMLAPIALVGVTYFGTTINVQFSTSASREVIGLVLASHLGLLPLFTAVLKTFSGEWHYRSIQLSLLLQPNRGRYAAAQLASVLLLWLLAALTEFAVYYPVKSATMSASDFPDFVGPRPLWILGIALLSALLSLLFVLAVTFLIPSPTAAVTVYLLVAGLFGYRYSVSRPELMTYVDPWEPARLLSEGTTDVVPTLTSSVLLVISVGVGLAMVRKRDAR